MEKPTTTTMLRVDAEVMRLIQRKQKPRETYNDVLRRLLGIEDAKPKRKTS